MGTGSSKSGRGIDFKPLLFETQVFASWTIQDVKELLKRFRTQIFGFAMVEAQFESIISFHKGVKKHIPPHELFDILDNDQDGRIDGLELLGGLALCCQASFEEKARFCFELFDFNLNASLSKKEMVMMMMSTLCGMNMLSGGGEELEMDLDTFERLADDAFSRADRDNSGAITYDEFVLWARSNREMMSGIERLNKLALDAKQGLESEDSAADTDEGHMSDAEVMVPLKALEVTKKATVISSAEAPASADPDARMDAWKSQIYEPTGYKRSKHRQSGPCTNMELEWAFGVASQSVKNSTRYIMSENSPTVPKSIVYVTASIGVVCDTETREQRFYQGHLEEITALALHPSGRLMATVDTAAVINIWDAITVSKVASIAGVVKQGYQHLIFSPAGDRLTSVGLDPDHTVTVYEFETAAVVSSGKGIPSPNNVNGIAYSKSGTEMAIVGKETIIFFRGVHTKSRALDPIAGRIGHLGKKQTFFCVAYLDEDAIVGCASGELYRFKDHVCVEIVQAHGIKDPVLCMHFSMYDGCLVTGGKDGLIKTWDPTLKEVGAAVDIAEDLNGDGQADNGCFDMTITSVQLIGNRILVATKGSDVFEIIMPSKPTSRINMKRVAWGHSVGELNGLAVHPFLDEFATSGDDKTLRTWDIRSHSQVGVKRLSCESSAVAYNNSGELICLGLDDGSMMLVTATSLRTLSAWHHCDQSITDIKFSPDDSFIAAACQDGNIYLYKSDDKRSFRRQAVCRGHTGAVLHIDFSAVGNKIQSNGADGCIMYWDMMGNHIKSNASMKDTAWATWTCTYGWAVQGIYGPDVPSSFINCTHAVPEVEVLLAGDDANFVNLYRYPSVSRGALSQSYAGHAGCVSQVRFSYNRRHVVSLGSTDRTILVWYHELEFEDSDDDVRSVSSASSAASANSSAERLATTLGTASKAGPSQPPIEKALEPWKSSVVEPTKWANRKKAKEIQYVSTDADFELRRVHGCRLYDCRNCVRYTAAGDIVYFAANLCIVYYRGNDTQKILQGAHTGPVIGLAAHPSSQIFASGEMSENPRIVVWNAEGVRTLRILEDCHSIGVSHLAFNGNGNLLASVGMDSDNTLALHEWSKGSLVFSTPTEKGTGRVLCVCFLGESTAEYTAVVNADRDSSESLKKLVANSGNIIMTGGVHHVKFWYSQGPNVKSQLGLWGQEKKQTITCAASASPMVCVTGTSHGDIIVWREFKIDLMIGENTAIKSPHRDGSSENVSIQSIWCKSNYRDNGDGNDLYITADAKGKIVFWDFYVDFTATGRFVKMQVLSSIRDKGPSPLQAMMPFVGIQEAPIDVSVTSICSRDGMLLIGTKSSDVYEMPFSVISQEKPSDDTNRREKDEKPKPPIIRVSPERHVVSGHTGSGKVRGLVTHPCAPVYFTSGDDWTIRGWSLEPHKQVFYRKESHCYRSLTMTSKGDYLVAGSTTGQIAVYKVDHSTVPASNPSLSLKFLFEIDDLTQSIHDIKFSPCDSLLAAACYDGNIYVFPVSFGAPEALPTAPVVTPEPVAEGVVPLLNATAEAHDFISRGGITVSKRKLELKGHNSHVNHVDFGIKASSNARYNHETSTFIGKDGSVARVPRSDLVLQSNDDSRELKFWSLESGKELSAMETRDTDWCTFTCPLGWPVQGIFSHDEVRDTSGTEFYDIQVKDVFSVCRNKSWRKLPVLAVSDREGHVRLFKYPCVVPGSPDKCYRGHSGSISTIRFSHDDSYCISIGSDDHCIFLWSTDIREEIKEQAALKIHNDSDSDADETPAEADLTAAKDAKVSSKAAANEEDDYEEKSVRKRFAPAAGDEAMAIKPWKGAVREPSTWVDRPDMAEKPAENLELNFVYGYRGWDTRNNINFAGSIANIVYHIAGVGVVFNTETHSQILNTEHDDDIISLCVHPQGHTVATGEVGKQPKIVVWDANTGVTLRIIKFHSKGVSHVGFSPCGKLLVSVGLDIDRIIAVHNVETGAIVGSGKVGKGIEVYSISISGNGGTFIVAGKNFVKFWDMPDPDGGRVELSCKGGIFSKKCTTVVSSAYLGVDPVTGMSDGSIYLWKGRAIFKSQQAHAEKSPVTAMIALPAANSGISSGSSSEHGPRIITGGKDGNVHIWNSQLVKLWSFNLMAHLSTTLNNQIQAVSLKESKLVLGTIRGEIYEVNVLTNEVSKLMDGHFDGELWGLASHPSKSRFVTCGDDKSVRVWDAKMRSPKAVVNVGDKARAVAFSPDGFQIAVGLFDGKVKILSEELDSEFKTVKVALEWIQCIKYSPNGASLAVGSHDSNIYILETRNYSVRSICKGHHSYIRELDFNDRSERLQTVSGDYEILFWNVSDGIQIKSASAVRDENWANYTCTLGWPVQGIWPAEADGTDINSVDRSPDGKLLASGDDFKTIKIFKYPCIKENAKFRSYKGHSEHIPSVRFSSDGKFLFSVGGLDKAVMQFQVKR